MKNEVASFRQADMAFQAGLYQSGNPTRRWLHQCREQWVSGRLASNARQQGWAFDCGVGSGLYTRQLAAMGQRVVAVDINEAFVRSVEGLPGVTALVADICDFRSLPMVGLADVAVCSEVLEHVPDVNTALQSLFAALRPGGRLVLTTPQRWSTTELTARLLKFRWVRAVARRVYQEPVDELGHISLMTAGDLESRLRAIGFEIVESDRFAFYLPVIAEVGGQAGQKLLAGCEGILKRIPFLRWMLWTQAYVVRRPG